MNRRIINGLIVICVTLCLPCAVISTVTGAGFVSGMFGEPENVNIEVKTPTTVTKGESFTIEVQVENLADQPQSLNSIDISLEYLAGIDIQKTEPPFTESIPNPGIHSYYFEQKILPGDTLVVELSTIGGQVGDFSGEIDVCLNSASSCSTFVTQTVVRE